jgi:ABC-2 type transport system ATP-binding protein
MIKIENLHKSYKDLKVLNGVNIHVHKGDVYGFIGSNGSGKSTTMNILTSLINYDEGKITINDNQPYTLGYLPETPVLFPYLTGQEYLKYIANCSNFTGDINKRSEEVLRLVSLFKASKRKIGGYSRGMTQRLGIAAAIYNNPDIIILDEPTSALDPEGRLEVVKIIEKLKENGKTIILSSHILDDVERVATKIGILSKGKIVLEDTLDNINSKNIDAKIYIVECEALNDEQISKLKEYPGKDVNVDTNRIKFELNNDQSGNDLLKYLISNNVIITKFELAKYNLETIYMEVTKNETN